MKLNIAKTVTDLPIPATGKQYYLPKWDKTTSYRATAWAYLIRDDGGNVVILDGEKWHDTKPQVIG